MGQALEFIVPGVRDVYLLSGCRCTYNTIARRGWENESLAAWAEMCKEGEYAIDVGAYAGIYAIIAARLGCKPIAVEPQPVMVDRMKKNFALNEVEVEIIAAAASDREGTAPLHYNPKVKLTSGASLTKKLYAAFIEVQTIRLDSLKLDSLCAMKIDVERHEPSVIAGALDLIRKFRPKLLVEALDKEIFANIMEMLPNYEAISRPDWRNVRLEPKHGH